MKDLYIIGAGGFGREVAWLVERINANNPEWTIKGFIDDNEWIWGVEYDGYKVLGGSEYLKRCENAYAVCAVGSAKTRKAIIEKYDNSNIKYATLIDPSVILSDSVDIGEGSIICAGTIITVDITIGKHVIINLDCTIGHDSILNDFVTLYPSVNVSGNVKIGVGVELGTGMQIIQGKNIGANTILGAGSVVTSYVPNNCTAVGVPAKPIKFCEE
ncbi:MAG: acetyltransferase [Lachnospiraceae bacterium]|nr:acetyltransferase [Lachnospiraceae bacterium]